MWGGARRLASPVLPTKSSPNEIRAKQLALGVTARQQKRIASDPVILGRAELPLGQVGSWRSLTEAEERESECSVPSSFARRVKASPQAPALAEGDIVVSYDELDRRSNRVAAGVLNDSGMGAPVGLFLEDSIASIVALIGVLKAGRIALPLEPHAPEAALAMTVTLAKSALVIVSPDTNAKLPARVRAIDEYACESDDVIEVPIEPGSGALLAFTSGSTGEPRGHLRSHRMTVHHALWDSILFGIGPGTRVAVKRSSHMARMQIFRPLLLGATALLYDTARLGLEDLGAWLTESEVEVAAIVPSMIDPLVAGAGRRGLPTLRVAAFGGEKVGRARARALQRLLPEGARLIHDYSSTETSRISCALIDDPIAINDAPLTVGFAVPGMSVSIRDPDGVPAERGEVVVESRYLAQRWEPDAEVPHEPTTRLHRTGDLGTVGPDGELTLLGREDRMVKVRGFRVQLDAIEHALLGLGSIKDAAVVDQPSPRGTRRLAAYVVLDHKRRPEGTATLRRELAAVLPGYMLPGRIVEVESLPLLRSGKLDLRAIAETPSSENASPPRGSIESWLAEIWAEVLELDDLGRDEDYLQLGGDSLSSAIIAAEVFARFGVELTPLMLEGSSTVSSMAATIERLQAAPRRGRRRSLVRARRGVPLPLGIVQETFLRDSLALGNEGVNDLATAIELLGDLDADAVRRAIEEIVRRHDVLRTTFSPRGKRWVQIVHPAPFVDLEFVDLRDRADPVAAAAQVLVDENQTLFDLERGPLARFRLLRTGEREHQLLRLRHHTISDSWSSNVFFAEFAAIYVAYREGRPSPLPELEFQFGDYAAWERRHVRRRSRYFGSELAWWRRTLTPRPEPMRLPFARPALLEQADPSDGTLDWRLPPELSQELDRLERACAASYFVRRLSIFAAYLVEVTAGRDVLLGMHVASRRLPELQLLIGLFASLTLLRLRVAGDPTLREWIASVRYAVAETSEHSALQYGALPWAFRGTRIGVPSLEVLFGAERSVPPWETSPIPGLRMREPACSRPPVTAIPTKFHVQFVDRSPSGEGEHCLLHFDARKYDPAGVRAFVDGFERFALRRCAHPEAPLGSPENEL